MGSNPMVDQMEGFFADVKAKVVKALDQNGDGKLTGADVKIMATNAEAEIFHIISEIVKKAEPMAVPLMVTAVSAVANSTGDKRKAALSAVEQGLISVGKTAVADTALDEAGRIGEMIGVSGNTVDQLRVGAVSLLRKNGLTPSNGVQAQAAS